MKRTASDSTSVSSDNRAPLRRFAVSVVLVNSIPAGINVQNVMVLVGARNEQEALGIGLPQAREKFPHHQVHTVMSLLVPDPLG